MLRHGVPDIRMFLENDPAPCGSSREGTGENPMKTTWSWLGDWTGLPATPEALADPRDARIPEASLERGATLDPMIVVGRVLEAGRHPNADWLSLCTVDVGGAVRSIVCGASNVAGGPDGRGRAGGRRAPGRDEAPAARRSAASSPRG